MENVVDGSPERPREKALRDSEGTVAAPLPQRVLLYDRAPSAKSPHVSFFPHPRFFFMTVRCLEVLLDAPLPALDYILPEGETAEPGERVVVPLGPKR